jgi:hypothetical protein
MGDSPARAIVERTRSAGKEGEERCRESFVSWREAEAGKPSIRARSTTGSSVEQSRRVDG